jgi:hypothetical protein
MGQWATRRKAGGAAWAVATAASAAAVAWYPRSVTRIRTYRDFFGTPRSYPYPGRDHPLRQFAPAVWLLSGALSALEAKQYVRHHTDPPVPPGLPAAGREADGSAELRIAITF